MAAPLLVLKVYGALANGGQTTTKNIKKMMMKSQNQN